MDNVYDLLDQLWLVKKNVFCAAVKIINYLVALVIFLKNVVVTKTNN